MATIPAYPPLEGPLGAGDLFLGWSAGTRRVTAGAILSYVLGDPGTGAAVVAAMQPVVAGLLGGEQPFTGSVTFANDVEGPPLLDLGDVSPPNGTYIGAGGNVVSFQTRFSNPVGGPDDDNQRASVLIAATTGDDNNSEEQTLCLLTTIQTGRSIPWAVLTDFVVGDNIRINGNIYRCVHSGTSAPAGIGPSGKADGIVDGSVIWNWINDDALGAKLGFYNEVKVVYGAGSAWAGADNIQFFEGYDGVFAVGREVDLTNDSGFDSVIGGKNKYCLYLQCNGSNTSTSAIDVGSSNALKAALLWGAHFTGAKLASNAIIQIDASSSNGIGIGVGAGGAANPIFSDSVFKDGGATAAKGISLGGNYSSSGVEVTGVTPASFAGSGPRTIAGIVDDTTGPVGLLLTGTYSEAQIGGNNFTIFPDGSMRLRKLSLGVLPPNYADDAAAAAGGVQIGDFYLNGSQVMLRVS